MDEEHDNTKKIGRLSKEQLEAIIPRLLEASDGTSVLQGLVPRVFARGGEDGVGKPYLVFCVGGSFHVFKEVEAKQAAENCGVADAKQRNTREVWKNELWGRGRSRFVLDTIEGIKLIHPDGREELISEMTFPDEDDG